MIRRNEQAAEGGGSGTAPVGADEGAVSALQGDPGNDGSHCAEEVGERRLVSSAQVTLGEAIDA